MITALPNQLLEEITARVPSETKVLQVASTDAMDERSSLHANRSMLAAAHSSTCHFISARFLRVDDGGDDNKCGEGQTKQSRTYDRRIICPILSPERFQAFGIVSQWVRRRMG